VEIILASASPRRAQLLSQVGVDFRVVGHEVDETIVCRDSPRSNWWFELAKQKAQAVARGLTPGW
jgi:septum formation protein